jgi:hypothetical protein
MQIIIGERRKLVGGELPLEWSRTEGFAQAQRSVSFSFFFKPLV